MKKFILATTLLLAVAVVSMATAFAAYKYFKDVEDNVWYTGAVNSLSEKGIVKGYPDGTFQPNKNVNRAEVAVMLDKTIKYLNGEELETNTSATSYTNAMYGFSFDHPANITMQKEAKENASTHYKITNPNAPVWEAEEGGPAQIWVTVYNNTEGLSLVDWTIAKQYMMESDIYQSKKIDGQDAIYLSTEGLGHYVVNVVQNGDNVYVLEHTYMTEDSVISQAYDKIVSTFKFI